MRIFNTNSGKFSYRHEIVFVDPYAQDPVESRPLKNFKRLKERYPLVWLAFLFLIACGGRTESPTGGQDLPVQPSTPETQATVKKLCDDTLILSYGLVFRVESSGAISQLQAGVYGHDRFCSWGGISCTQACHYEVTAEGEVNAL